VRTKLSGHRDPSDGYPVKRSDQPLLAYVTRGEFDAMLAVLDCNTWLGRRDYALLLLTMFNTGALVSPHTFRHGTAMALLQSGVDIAVIALWLGHESIETTHKYVEADMAMKEKALATLAPPGPNGFRRFQGDDTLMAFLASL